MGQGCPVRARRGAREGAATRTTGHPGTCAQRTVTHEAGVSREGAPRPAIESTVRLRGYRKHDVQVLLPRPRGKSSRPSRAPFP
jgi:hypothetical protein